MPAATLRALHLGEYHALDVTARYELLSMLCDLVLATATARRLLDDRSARVEAIEWDWETATQVGLAQLQPLTIPPRVLPLGRDRDSSTVYWSLPTALAVVRQQYGEPDLKAGTVDEAAAAAFAAAAAAAKAAAGDVPPTPPPPPMPPAAAPAAADATAAADDDAPAAEEEKGETTRRTTRHSAAAPGGGARGGAGGRGGGAAASGDAPLRARSPPPAAAAPAAEEQEEEAAAAAPTAAFSAEEDAAIREGVRELGRKWREIGKAAVLQGRDSDALRRRFDNHLAEEAEEDEGEGGGGGRGGGRGGGGGGGGGGRRRGWLLLRGSRAYRLLRWLSGRRRSACPPRWPRLARPP